MRIQQLGTLLLLAWNLFVFLVYGLDKGKARQQDYRIPEKTLLLMALFGGGLGACLAGYFFHHKTRKWYFQLTWWLGVCLDAVLLYWIWK